MVVLVLVVTSSIDGDATRGFAGLVTMINSFDNSLDNFNDACLVHNARWRKPMLTKLALVVMSSIIGDATGVNRLTTVINPFNSI